MSQGVEVLICATAVFVAMLTELTVDAWISRLHEASHVRHTKRAPGAQADLTVELRQAVGAVALQRWQRELSAQQSWSSSSGDLQLAVTTQGSGARWEWKADFVQAQLTLQLQDLARP